MILDKESLWTLPLGTMQYQGQYSSDVSLVAAFVTLSAIPAIIFYLFAERQIVAGLTAGALKGYRSPHVQNARVLPCQTITSPSRSTNSPLGCGRSATSGATRSAAPVRERARPRPNWCTCWPRSGAYGVNFHDNDLVPIDATPAERDRIVAGLQEGAGRDRAERADGDHQPVLRPGLQGRGLHLQRPEGARLRPAEDDARHRPGGGVGAKIYVFWGGREGVETDASKDPVEAIKRIREAINFLCEYVLDQKYDLKFALEAKPNEPRGDIYNPTTGHMLAFIETLDHPEMVGVNPEVAHEQMSGLNFMHGVAQAWEAGKLFHIDLNDQYPGRYDQDLRFGSRDLKAAFFLVKFLEDVGYAGSRHFDAHAYRTEDYEGVKDFARGCMRTYLILKEKAAQFNADPEIQALLAEINADDGSMSQYSGKYSTQKAETLKATSFDRPSLGARGLRYERLDQLTVEVLLGVR